MKDAEENGSEETINCFVEVVHELLAKVKDLYCVLPSLVILSRVLDEGVKIKSIKDGVFTQGFVNQIVSSVSTPNLHVPSYNFKTRNQVYQIFTTITANTHFNNLAEPTLLMTAISASVEGEADPRNLLIMFDLL